MARSSEAMSFGAKRCTVGSCTSPKPVGDQLGRGQHVAQVMAHLADGQAQRGQPALLLQHRMKLATAWRAARCSATAQSRRGGRDGTMMREASSGSSRRRPSCWGTAAASAAPAPVEGGKDKAGDDQRQHNREHEDVEAVARMASCSGSSWRAISIEFARHVGREVDDADDAVFGAAPWQPKASAIVL